MNFTGVPEVDFNILLKLDLPDLFSACQSSTYLSELCTDDYLWYLKSEKDYPQLLSLKKDFSSWREFYINVRTNAVYYLLGPDEYVSNNIGDVYRKLIRVLSHEAPEIQFPPLEHSDELPAALRGADLRIGEVNLYVLFVNRPISLDHPDKILFSLMERTIKPNLKEYPRFKTQGVFVPRIDDDIRVDRLTSKRIFGSGTVISPINRESLVLLRITRGTYVKSTIPVMVFSKIGEEYLFASIPDRCYNELEFDSDGREVWATLDSLQAALPEIIPGLEWEPLENLVNYN